MSLSAMVNMIPSYLTVCDTTDGFSNGRRGKGALECKVLSGVYWNVHAVLVKV